MTEQMIAAIVALVLVDAFATFPSARRIVASDRAVAAVATFPQENATRRGQQRLLSVASAANVVSVAIGAVIGSSSVVAIATKKNDAMSGCAENGCESDCAYEVMIKSCRALDNHAVDAVNDVDAENDIVVVVNRRETMVKCDFLESNRHRDDEPSAQRSTSRLAAKNAD